MRLKEELADLEHQQWAHWTQYMLDNLTPENIDRWRRQIDTPYINLSEKEKKSDRRWYHLPLMSVRARSKNQLCCYYSIAAPGLRLQPINCCDGTKQVIGNYQD
jgi:hypothetical protein